jgi:hypothetical protein
MKQSFGKLRIKCAKDLPYMKFKTTKLILPLTLGLILTLALPLGQNLAMAQTAQSTGPNSGAGINSSHNWSGYVAMGGGFTSVTGNWVIPQIPATTGLTGDATWVGIGGVTSNDLIQIGTQALTNTNGPAVSYQAWYETLPGYSQPIPITINSGDSITASLTEQTQNQWVITLSNNTNGQNFKTVLSYTSSSSSAEWIQEMPSRSSGALIPLDNFGAIQFSSGGAVKNGQTLNIAQSGATTITMVNFSQQVLATPSSLGNDGASFSVSRSSAIAASPTPLYYVRRGQTIGIRVYSRRPQSFRQSYYKQFSISQVRVFADESLER